MKIYFPVLQHIQYFLFPHIFLHEGEFAGFLHIFLLVPHEQQACCKQGWLQSGSSAQRTQEQGNPSSWRHGATKTPLGPDTQVGQGSQATETVIVRARTPKYGPPQNVALKSTHWNTSSYIGEAFSLWFKTAWIILGGSRLEFWDTPRGNRGCCGD